MGYRVILITLISVLTGTRGLAQTTPCQKAEKLISTLSQHHIQSLPVDDEWSKRVFDNFFSTLDPFKIYFTKEDVQKLQEHSITLDDLIKNQKPCAFVDAVSVLFKSKLQDYSTWLEKSLSASFNYSESETFDAIRLHAHSFAQTERDLEIRWKHYSKYQILVRMSQESLIDTTLTSQSLLAYEKVSREKIKKKEIRNITNILEKEKFENQMMHSFLQAIASSYDPHTAYYSSGETEEFKSSISSSELSFGFALEEDHLGTVRVVSIIPGGPAWNSNEVHEGDLLLAIEASGTSQLNIMDYSVEEIAELLGSHSVQHATFSIKKTDGAIKHITLTKEKVESIENTVSGVVLKGVKNVGYIALPSFYFDWENEGASGCANDVAKAIIKLNKEKIEGLILDLRFNGGGSLEEALGLAGIFIDYGPLGLYQETGQPIITLKDQNKGTIYNGPLLVMVNGFSGSASEFFSATMQDYNRALIVGSRTFGKGTGQDIFPLSSNNSSPSGDHVKITTLKIYRITGKTYQHKGVIPHIDLPDMTDVFEFKESEYIYALPSDSITKKTYYTPFPSFPVTTLREKSKSRIAESLSFQNIQTLRKALFNPIPIDHMGFKNYMLQFDEPSFDAPSIFTAHNTNYDNPLLMVDSFKRAQNETFLLKLQESIYIQEAYNVMIDYIAIQKK